MIRDCIVEDSLYCSFASTIIALVGTERIGISFWEHGSCGHASFADNAGVSARGAFARQETICCRDESFVVFVRELSNNETR